MSKKGDVGADSISWTHHWEVETPEDRTDFNDPNAFDYAYKWLPKPPFTVLECGAGGGFWSNNWKLIGGIYSGLDANEAAIKLARRKHPGLVFYHEPAEEMGLIDLFDVVFTHTCLQHTSLEQKKQIVPRVHKALHKNGLFIIEETTNDGNTATTFTKDGWISFIEPYGFLCVASTPKGDNRNGMVFISV